MILTALAITTTIALPAFGRVAVYAPAQPATRVVLLLSDSAGWTDRAAAVAERLRADGALVAGVNYRTFKRGMEWSAGCTYPAGDLEDLSRAVQLQQKLPSYQRPILAGLGAGGTIVFAAIASAPEESFAGGVSVDYSPVIALRVPLCEERRLFTKRRSPGVYTIRPVEGLRVPWQSVSGTGMADAIATIARGRAAAPAPATPAARADANVDDLALAEVPASSSAARDVMAIVLSGDGGWAELDKSVAAGLAAAGVPTVGWSSLRYYWSPKTPELAARDLARVVDHYSRAWHKSRVLIVGYSFGADVLPFLVTRLPDALRSRVAAVALLGPDESASFEFHLADWIGTSRNPEFPTAPEVAKLAMPVLCVQGNGDSESACGSFSGPRVRTVTIGAGHHFGGEYGRVAAAILATLPP